MNQRNLSHQPVAITLTVVAALLRVLPHPSNFSPIGGVALFGGAKLRSVYAYLIPLVAMLVTDPIRSWAEGGYPAYSWMTPVIYLSFLISVFLGRTFIGQSNTPARIGVVALVGSFQFFLITNFATWIGGSFYPHTVAGLTTCYVAALPFFARTILADLFYSGVLFSAYAILSRRLGSHNRTAAA